MSDPGTTRAPLTDPTGMRQRLLSWYRTHRRDLPWRGLRDPYAIWVSEIMLQQTRVETVIPYFLRWMERFPDVHALAAADEDSVLQAWSGLGYYSRVRNLHRAAQVVVREHDGAMPRSREALRRLPGIGAYTSGAIASIAFDEVVPAVDGNVLRVLARILGDDRDILAPSTRTAFEAHAARLVSPTRPGDWNQALMELGATCCTPNAPACGSCPFVDHCAAHALGRTEGLPVRRRRAAPQEERMHFAWVLERDRVLLVRHPRDGLLGGLWGLPGGPAGAPLAGQVHAQAGVVVRTGPSLGHTRHRFTHRAWAMALHEASPEDGAEPSRDGMRWVPLRELDDQPLSTAHRKLIEVARATPRTVPPLRS